MDSAIALLTEYGYAGMLTAAFIAGSFFPLSSEVVMLGLMAAGLDPWGLMAYATVGNMAGSLLNYCIGRLGKPEWTWKYLHVNKEAMERAQRFMAGKGAWVAFFSFLPVIGTALTIVLGVMRANLPIVIVSLAIGKALRYLLVVLGVEIFI